MCPLFANEFIVVPTSLLRTPPTLSQISTTGKRYHISLNKFISLRITLSGTPAVSVCPPYGKHMYKCVKSLTTFAMAGGKSPFCPLCALFRALILPSGNMALVGCHVGR